MSAAIPAVIYFDARALQDPDYRFRGVGQHSSSLIDALRTHPWSGERPRLVAVTDTAREPLKLVHEVLFDDVLTRPEPAPQRFGRAADAWFLSLSPMTHDPVWAAPFLSEAAMFKAALFYDLIPLEFPERYLRVPTLRFDYVMALAWLRRFDAFAAISRFSADGLIERIAVDRERVFVSGVAVRKTLEPLADEVPFDRADRKWLVVSGGGDPRKNPECAIVAHAGSHAFRKAGLPLVIFGNYPDFMRAEMRRLYAEKGGRPQDLQFQPHLSDADLHQVYRRGLATIVPSRAEGFSIPIVESSAAGTPVLASDVGAHPELARDPAWRFDPEKPAELRELMERLLADAGAWEDLKATQAALWTGYTTARVSATFVEGLLARAVRKVTPSGPAVIGRARPQIAVLTPLPPALSGVADYSAATLRPLQQVAEVHMYTPSKDAVWEPGWASLNDIAALDFAPMRFDATLSVMGNSFHHMAVFEHVLRRGGPCLAHDARQIDFYFHLLGAARTMEVAEAEMGKPVPIEQIAHWLRNQRELPTLFLSELVRASSPLMVHSPTTATEIQRLYSHEPIVLPFAQYRRPLTDRLNATGKAEARRRLKISDDVVLLASFGIVSEDKAPDELLQALNTLRGWGVNAQLALCGFCPEGMHPLIRGLLSELRLQDHVHWSGEIVGEEVYDDYLTAADVGIQLRNYHMGGLSGALNDCIAAALPSIANDHLATAMLAPDFVERVPDSLSAVLIAEAVLRLMSRFGYGRRPLEEARRFSQARTPVAYSRALLHALELPDAAARLQDV